MRNVDVIVLGGGSGDIIADHALMQGLTVAMFHIPPIGGTCQNYGCIPSKILIYPADQIMRIHDAKKVGVEATINNIDFQGIMKRMRDHRAQEQHREYETLQDITNFTYVEGEAHFTNDYTVESNNQLYTAEKIFIGVGARPFIPPVEGLDHVSYLTNETVLDLEKLPSSIIIVGGGYIAVEYAHFFSALGSHVILLQDMQRIVPNEEPDVSDLLQLQLSQRMQIHTDMRVVKAEAGYDHVIVTAQDTQTKKDHQFTAEKLFIAAGRVPNSDRLHVEATGIEVDERGYIKVNEYLETSKPRIWAFGDITGHHMYKHVANREAFLAWHNAAHDHKAPMTYDAIPHAVFTYPQIAGVGLTEAEALKAKGKILVGTAHYRDVAKGLAMNDEYGYGKAIVDYDTGRILGFHIVGTNAAILIQEIINAMSAGNNIDDIYMAMHIHPALTEFIPRVLEYLVEVESSTNNVKEQTEEIAYFSH
jgi:mycothione reductase